MRLGRVNWIGYDATERCKMAAAVEWADCGALESVPGKVSGAWVFKGTRVPVSAIMANLKSLTVDQLVEEFPTVTKEQIRAVLDFVADSAAASTHH